MNLFLRKYTILFILLILVIKSYPQEPSFHKEISGIKSDNDNGDSKQVLKEVGLILKKYDHRKIVKSSLCDLYYYGAYAASNLDTTQLLTEKYLENLLKLNPLFLDSLTEKSISSELNKCVKNYVLDSKILFGICTGLNFLHCNIIELIRNENLNLNYTNYSLGFSFEYRFANKWSILSDLDFNYTANSNHNYVVIPETSIYIKHQLFAVDKIKWRFSFLLGEALNTYSFNAKYANINGYSYGSGNTQTFQYYNFSGTSSKSSFDLNPFVGIGCTYSLKKCSVGANLIYNYYFGITNTSPEMNLKYQSFTSSVDYKNINKVIGMQSIGIKLYCYFNASYKAWKF